tara:strand:+ start:4997 stop:5677 length:681 start_codon:yes stop_codon:yes gene_type:complete
MTSILAIETSTPACSVALSFGDTVISRYCEEPRSHTRLIMPMVDAVLNEAGIKAVQLDGLAVTIGPGSFTGLRIGFATIQGFAFGLDLPVVPVSTLQVMAQTASRKHSLNDGAVIMAVLDARMGEVNCGCYRIAGDGAPRALMQDQLLGADQIQQVIAQWEPEAVVGEAAQLIAPVLFEVYPDALDLLELATPTLIQGLAQSIDSIELVYLRGNDAWQKRKRIRTV